MGFETLTVAGTPIGPTSTFHTAAWALFGPTEGTSPFRIRWRDDGTQPTGGVGHIIGEGETFLFYGDLSKLQFIRVTAENSATVPVSYYK